MENLLPLTWYIESPIDFEHKEYVLYSYLQKVDHDFHNKMLSPHLLHLEKLIDELLNFDASFNMIKKDFDKNRYVFFENVKLVGEDDKLIYEIRNIVEFAIPQVEPRIKLGYSILKRNNQILY
jgi:hypothetical protein